MAKGKGRMAKGKGNVGHAYSEHERRSVFKTLHMKHKT